VTPGSSIGELHNIDMNDENSIWQAANGAYALPAHEVHVWRASLNLPESSYFKMWQSLSPDERGRANRFHFDVDRKRSVLGRGLLRLLLGHILRRPAGHLQFECNEFGKPRLIAGQGPPLHFNLSHSGDLVLVAITIGREVGIDVEKIRLDFAVEEVAAQTFSAKECKLLASLTTEARYRAFFSCWTRKEAYLKARGTGLSLPADQFDVSFLSGVEPQLLETRNDPADANRWTLRALHAGRDYEAALAVERSSWKLKCWDWPTSIVEDIAGG